MIHYLRQVRDAIRRDFGRAFLGNALLLFSAMVIYTATYYYSGEPMYWHGQVVMECTVAAICIKQWIQGKKEEQEESKALSSGIVSPPGDAGDFISR